MNILELKNVSIRYVTGDYKEIGLKEFILRKLQGKYQASEFWAARDISFELEKGDMLGIIGPNGAGKSTLLKCVSGIMEPSGGSVSREGNIAALLELGSGFDGDLTVKENTYLRGALLGYTRKYMDETYEDIIEFAELKEFENRPFKQLSTGMRSRLAFAIASLVKPDILILDEVLSVGDASFRRKSESKMREILASGTTTILVSHSIEQVRSICNKVLWLDKGRQVEFGTDVLGICDRYVKSQIEAAGGVLAAPRVHLRHVESSGKPKLFWNPVKGAEKYEVYRCEKGDEDYLKVFITRNTNYINSSAVPGVEYHYKVCAVFENTIRIFAEPLTAFCLCGKPDVLGSLDPETGKPTMKWDALSDVERYEIYRSKTLEGTYEKICALNECNYSEPNAVAGKIYYYKVRAFDKLGHGGEFSEIVILRSK